ncbi:uncharacterized protein LOC122073516 isoform X2 [Macadamia integrifolia]|uniref:uncharacterized protein LOC122073516 isoform X2 n=1 Tax=Macadamia integrifolia TaxID=60698 RepID=UPI001C4F6E4F|nr:uncharacterized protein LOC122073516 isoform X2 [Macadamia integrifolia]
MIIHPHPPQKVSNYYNFFHSFTLGFSTMADLRCDVPENYGYSSDSSIRARRTAQNYENYRYLDGGGIEFRARSEGDHESGPPSPTLWKTSPARITESEASLLHPSSLSPVSRRHAIAKSRRELMEMIRNMPETSYELSLQDLVEQPHVRDSRDMNSNDSKTSREKAKRKKNQERNKGRMRRSVSMENEPVLLKMFFPLSLGSMKKSFSMDTGSKISQKSPSLDAQEKGVDKEWWKRRYSVAGDSDSGVASSNNSGSTGSSGSSSIGSRSSSSSKGRRRIGGLIDCWSCFQTMENTL